MAHGGPHRPPYRAAWRLLLWAWRHWNELDGQLLLAGYLGGVEALDLRQVCNASYAAITMWMSEKDHHGFDRELLAPLGKEGQVSHGTKSLMAVMGVRPPSAPMGRRPIPGEDD